MGWNDWSIPKLQRINRWSLGMDKSFHPTVHNGCNYLSILGLKLNHVSKRGHRKIYFVQKQILLSFDYIYSLISYSLIPYFGIIFLLTHCLMHLVCWRFILVSAIGFTYGRFAYQTSWLNSLRCRLTAIQILFTNDFTFIHNAAQLRCCFVAAWWFNSVIYGWIIADLSLW